MKKIIFIMIFALTSLSTPLYAFAVSPTPNQAMTTQIQDQINTLKDTIASKVAQLKLVEKKGIIGSVTDVSETQITLKDTGGNIHFIDVDELTSFSSGASSNFGISDITKNSTLGILGLYNKESRRTLARFVTQLTLPHIIHGAIATIDKTNFTLTVVQNDQSQTVAEVEDVTKISSYDGTALAKSGFSKSQVGERVYVVGFADKQNPKELIASRIIVFPSLAINPAIGPAVPLSPTSPSTPSASPTKAL